MAFRAPFIFRWRGAIFNCFTVNKQTGFIEFYLCLFV